MKSLMPQTDETRVASPILWQSAKKCSQSPRLWRPIQAGLILSDALAIMAAFRAAYWIRFEMALPLFRLDVVPPPLFYYRLFAVLVPIWVIIFALLGLYQKKNIFGGLKEYALVFRGATIGMLILIVAGFVDPGFIIARGWLSLSWVLGFLFPEGNRFLWRRLVYQMRLRGYLLSPAIVVGANEEGLMLAEQILDWKTSGLNLIGIVDGAGSLDETPDFPLPLLGECRDLEAIVRAHDVQELVIATSALTRKEFTDIFKRFGVSDHINLRMSSGLFEVITTGLEVKEVAYIPLVSINKVRLTGGDRVMKFLLDYGLTLPALLLISPFLLLIAIAIRLDSSGPALYRRRVLGLYGKEFDAYKFRTMHVDGDKILDTYPELKAELQESHKLKQDPRITRVGRLLRKFSLDELPQLLNVLRGEMSLVGPRMISPEEIREYEKWGMNLLTVRPGITGLWQVSGRSDITYEERVRLDMYYIRNWSILLDLHLLLRTIPAVLSRRGAY